MAGSAKKWWLATGAVSAVVAGLIIFCVPKCNRTLKDSIVDSEDKDTVVVVDNSDKIRQLTDSIAGLKQDLRETQEMLNDCRQGSVPQPEEKVKPQQPRQKKKVQRKKKKVTSKTDTVSKINATQSQPSAQGVNVNSIDNSGAIVIRDNNNVVVQRVEPAVVADSLNTFKRVTTVTVTVKTKTRQRVYY